MSQIEKKDWREISENDGSLITLAIIVFYMVIHFRIMKYGAFWVNELTLAFGLGMMFHFLVNIKPGQSDTLVDWRHRELKTKWSNGLHLVPCLFPALHRIGLHLGWSLKNIHHYQPEKTEERNLYIHHDVRFNSSRQEKIEVDAKLSELIFLRIVGSIFSWYFSLGKNPALKFQEFGLRIILIVFFLDCISLAVGSSPKDKIITATIGKCINIPKDDLVVISMRSLPIERSFGIQEKVTIFSPKEMEVTWDDITQTFPQNFNNEIILVTKTSWWWPINGKICF